MTDAPQVSADDAPNDASNGVPINASAAALPVLPGNDSPPADVVSPARYWLGLLALLVMVLGVYWPSMKGDFLWDDDYYVVNNPALKHDDGIQQIWAGITSPRTYPVPQFYPMTHTSFWAQTRGHDWAKPLSPLPFHLGNVLLHFASAWMLWTVLRRLKVPGAFVAAAIWALHPVQVESVAWITERKNVLSAFFFFGALLTYLRYSRLEDRPANAPRGYFSLPPERWKLYLLTLLLFVCSILSKSVTGSFPAVVLLLVWWKRRELTEDDLLPLIPFFVLAAAMGITTSYFERNIVGAIGPEWAFKPLERLSIAGGAIWFYAGKLLWPAKLSFVYPRWNLSNPLLISGFVAAAAALAMLFVLRGRIGRGAVVLGLLFVGSLFPALGFVNVFPMRYSFVADHFQYLSSAAVIIAVVWLLHRFFTTPGRFTFATALILGALCALTWKQNHLYAHSGLLWEDTVNKNPDAWMAWNNLGVLQRDSGDLTAADASFQRVLAVRPGQVEALMNLGLVAERRGDFSGAVGYLRQAAEESEKDTLHGAAYARVFYNLGRLLQKTGDKEGAFASYHLGNEKNPRDLNLLNAMGALLLEQGDVTHARAWLDKALKLEPDFLPARNNLGNVLLRQGDAKGAVEQWTIVLQRDKNNLTAINNSARYLAMIGQFDAAIALFKQALTIKPDFEEGQRNLSLAIRMKQQAATRPSARPTTRGAGEH